MPPTPSPVFVAHDAFVRTSLRRTAFMDTKRACAWCGQQPRTLYGYVLVPDDRAHRPGRYNLRSSDPLFCNLECYRTHFS